MSDANLFETFSIAHSAESIGDDRVDTILLPQASILVVADGAGGSAGGSLAADMVIGHVRAYCATENPDLSEDSLTQLVLTIDNAVADDPLAGETTALLAVVTNESIVGISVGDSDGYLVFGDRDYPLTPRHSKPYLGHRAAAPESFVAEIQNGILLLGSDGLWKYASTDRVLSTVRTRLPLYRMASALIDLVRLRNGGLQDDISIALCRRA